ncbi:MAG TPA: hypothetical protein DCE42_22865 [Myxococcales bacterium]|nr:hypothetical protein [Deltaproteobacteria bacterium]MBU52444.1 hypothetical protein [Deltaproteobacteria bacterium]HAA57627.1 hypothetical protein [Myxococcales bacterium]|tara:strand:+ start:1091 stop:2329 length:1239 start_codon:yes stop_codon:yes gene_type:complete
MMLLFRMGLKNIGRKKSRSVLTISAVVLCSMGIMLFVVLMDGTVDMMMSGIVEQFGHVRLVHEKIVKKPRLYAGSYFVGDAHQLMKNIKKVPGVVGVVPRIELGAYLDHKGIQASAGGFGLDPKAEVHAMELRKKIKKGKIFQPRKKGSKVHEVVLGWRLARRLKVKVGGTVLLLGQTVDDSVSAIKGKVVGITYTGTGMLDKMFYMSIPSAQYFLDIPDKVSSMLIYGRNIHQSRKLLPQIEAIKRPKGIAVQNWESSSYFAKMIPIVDLYVYFLGGLIVFIAGIGLMNTMTMSVMERKGEVGVMMALGFTRAKVAIVFLVEGLFLGIIGAILGVIIGSLLSIPLVTIGLTIQADVMADFPIAMESTFRGSYTLSSVILGLLVGIFSTLAGTMWPAIQASRMAPVDALRDE